MWLFFVIEDAIRRSTAAPSFWAKRSEVCSTIPSTIASRRSVTRNVVFGGFWKRLEVLGTLLELPSKLGGLGGRSPPRLSVWELKCRLLTLYAVCCMLSVVCYMLCCMLYTVYCMLFWKLLEMPEFFEYLSKISPIWGPKLIQNGVPAGSWAVQVPSGETMLARDRFFIDLGLHFGSLLEPCWAQKPSRNRFGAIPRAPKDWTRSWMASNIDFWLILDPFWTYFWRVFGIRFKDRRHVHVHNATTCEILHFSSQSPPVYDFGLADEFSKNVKEFSEKC